MRHEQDQYDKQYTNLWNVDDLKTSHVDPDVISRVFAEIDAEYEKIWNNDHHEGQSE